MTTIFPQLAALLGVTVAVAGIGKLLKQPIMIAYIIAGIAAGPVFLNIVHKEQELFGAFSQFGVVLLLFMVGLNLNFVALRKIGITAFIGGLAQVVFTAVIGTGILLALDFALMPSIYLAVAITFSSTIIITKLLSDKKHTDSLYGRHTIGLMLVQDVVAIILMILLTSQGVSISESLVRLAIGAAILIAIIVLAARYILPPILKGIASSTEFLFLFALAWCFAMTYLATRLGFSAEIGAVAAGIALGSSVYQSEIAARITPLRDFFLIIFFIILGTELNVATISAALLPGIILGLFILIGNPLILYLVYRRMHFSRRNSLLIGLTAAQVSEFGFVLLFLGQSLGYVGDMEMASFTLVALSTIFASSYLITYNERIFVFLRPFLSLFGKEKYEQIDKVPVVYDAWVVGYHRIGWNIVQALKKSGLSFAVIDFDPQVVQRLSNDKVPAYFLDVGDATLLSELPLERAQTIISTIPNIENQITLIRHVRAHNKESVVIANAPEARFMEELYNAGADYVMTPHLLGGRWIGQLISVEKMSKEEFRRLREEQQKEVAEGLPVALL